MKYPEYANLREAMFAIYQHSAAAQHSVNNLRIKLSKLPLKDRSDIVALEKSLAEINRLSFDLPLLVGKAIGEARHQLDERWSSAVDEIRRIARRP